MKLLHGAIGAFTFLAVLTNPVHAWGRRCDPCPPAGCEVKYVDKVITCLKPQLVEKEVKCIVNKIVCKEIETEQKCTVMIPEWKEEKRTINVCKSVPKEVEQDVVCYRMVPTTVKDSCTGCTHTVCRPEAYKTKVKACVWELHEEKQEVTVRVCHFRAEERVHKCKRMVYECIPETVTRKVYECVLVPQQVTVKVPVCLPCCK